MSIDDAMDIISNKLGGISRGTSTLIDDTPRQSTSPHSSLIRVRIRPKAPLPTQPLLISCVEQSTFTAFKARILSLINAKSDQQFVKNNLRLEIEGFTIAEDCLVGDVIRETDIIDVFNDVGESGSEEQIVRGSAGSAKRRISSSTSSSSSSSSEDRSSEDSSSSSSSSSSSDDENKDQYRRTTTQTNGSVYNWVPPGQGTTRTQRNNERRRKRARADLDAEREKRFIETIKRVEKQALVGSIEEEADQSNSVNEQIGDSTSGFMIENGIHPSSNFDSTLTLPPGGGLLGLPTANLSMDSTMGHSSRSQRSKKAKSTLPNYRRILPPSQREEPIPSCIRLTRVDCDDCVTPWPTEGDEMGDEEEEEEDESPDGADDAIAKADALYLAFKAQGQEALKKMRDNEDKQEKQRTLAKQSDEETIQEQAAAFGMPVTFGKPNGWDGHEVVVSSRDGSTQQQDLSSPILDYGIPNEGKTESAPETLERLRKLRDETQLQSMPQKPDLLSIRQAALQSMRRRMS